MASKGGSRWADSEEDAALEAQRRKEKEEKKRLKAEKARKEAEQAEQLAAQQQEQQQQQAPGQEHQQEGDASNRPAKRRKLTPEQDAAAAAADEPQQTGGRDSKLLRFSGGHFGKCRSVENYDKLNDIEEGTYGWVSRAREVSTGKVVALKRLKIDPRDRGGLPVTGLREIQILKDCQHDHIVNLQEVVVGDDTSKFDK